MAGLGSTATQAVGVALPMLGLDWLAGVSLAALRVAATFMMTPVFYAMPMPRTVRMLLVGCISLAMASGLTITPGLWSGWAPYLQAALAEIALGATLGLGVLLAFGAFAVAGQLLDVQLGYGIAQIIDPVTSRPVPIITSAFSYLSVVVFFLVDGHHALLRGVAYGLERFPAGAPWPLANAVGPLLKQATGLFSLGFALAAPVIFCLLLVEFVLGVVSRNLPQMNMFAMGFPVKILVGLVALSIWFTGIGGVMTRAYATVAITWDAIFSAEGLSTSQERRTR